MGGIQIKTRPTADSFLLFLGLFAPEEWLHSSTYGPLFGMFTQQELQEIFAIRETFILWTATIKTTNDVMYVGWLKAIFSNL